MKCLPSIRNHILAGSYALLNTALYFEGTLLFLQKIGVADHSAFERQTVSDDVMFGFSFLTLFLLVANWDGYYHKNQKWFDNQNNQGCFGGLSCWQSITKICGLIGSGVKTLAGGASFFKIAVDAGANIPAAAAGACLLSFGHFFSSVSVLSDQEAKPEEDASRALLEPQL